jgi:hypothetical protein
MKKLIALLAAIGAIVFFWRKKQKDDEVPAWGSDTASSWSDSAASETKDSGEPVVEAASEAADGD